MRENKNSLFQRLQIHRLSADDGQVLSAAFLVPGHPIQQSFGIGTDVGEGGTQVVSQTGQKFLPVVFALALLMLQLLQPLGSGVEVGTHRRKLIIIGLGQPVGQLSLPQTAQTVGQLLQRVLDFFQHTPGQQQIDKQQGQQQAAQREPAGKLLGEAHMVLEVLHGSIPLLQQIHPAQPICQKGKQQIGDEGQGKHEDVGPEQTLFQ